MINWNTLIALALSFGSLIVICVGVGIFLKANNAKAKEVANTGLNLFVGFIIIGCGLALGAGGIAAWNNFGGAASSTVGVNIPEGE